MLATGVAAPVFKLRDLNDEEQSLNRLLVKGPALLVLFKVNCPVCQYTFPFLERIATEGSLQVVGISQDNAAATRKFRAQFGGTFSMLLDGQGYPVSNAFGIVFVPSLFLVEQDGKISLVSEGFAKADLERLGERAGVAPFHPGEKIPSYKAG